MIRNKLLALVLALTPVISHATVSSNDRRDDYTANGSLSVYAYTFPILSASEITVIVRDTDENETTLSYITDYTLSGVGSTSGGNVTLVDVNQAWLDADGDLTVNYVISILGNTPKTQTTNIRNQGAYYPDVIETQFDRFTMQIQQMQNELDRCIKLEPSVYSASTKILASNDRANQFLAFNASGVPYLAAGVSSATTASAFAQTLLDDSTASTARDTLGASSGVWPTTLGGTALSSYTLGDILYSSATNVLAKLSGNTTTTPKVLMQTGNGSVSAAPAWTAFTAPTVQKFTSGSGTYTTATSPRTPIYIRVRMVGGGGGGGGSGTGSAGSGAAGGNTTFGSSLLVANGGAGGAAHVGVGGAGGTGGTASLGTGPIGTALSGGIGSAAIGNTVANVVPHGGAGAASPFGGAGGGAVGVNAGGAGAANSGSGGGGGGADSAGSSGAGGGAGGFVDAIIASPSATYAYAVGAAGTAGTAGTGGAAGGAGGSGYIEVTEYYQ